MIQNSMLIQPICPWAKINRRAQWAKSEKGERAAGILKFKPCTLDCRRSLLKKMCLKPRTVLIQEPTIKNLRYQYNSTISNVDCEEVFRMFRFKVF